MRKPKHYYPVIAAAALAVGGFIPASLGGEKVTAKAVATKKADLTDPVFVKLNDEIVKPLALQSKRWESFSRRKPTASTSYNLVEADAGKAKGERRFQIMRVSTPYVKGAESTTSEYLKLKYLEDSHKVLVDLKGKWVTIDEHPVLKQLPKPEQKIIP